MSNILAMEGHSFFSPKAFAICHRKSTKKVSIHDPLLNTFMLKLGPGCQQLFRSFGTTETGQKIQPIAQMIFAARTDSHRPQAAEPD
jgi:hypothetical protein